MKVEKLVTPGEGLLKNRPGEMQDREAPRGTHLLLQPQCVQSRYHEVRQEATYDKRNKKPKMMEEERYDATSIPSTEHTSIPSAYHTKG
ncbi:hypothetical protein JTB14_034105 [Gonioctena quinquepunctata]|nr:hypothetical protein JTB14_034105 [Gonioctena quinquepunctata]